VTPRLIPLLISGSLFALAQVSCSSSDTQEQAQSSAASSSGTAASSSGTAAGSSGTTSSGTTSSGSGGATPEMSFFVTSKGLGKGGDLGGLAGADAHCKALATAAGSKKTQWFAYLSVKSGPGGTPVNARDRIGTGPWHNAKGVAIAESVADLHANMGMDNALNIDVAIDENGAIVPGRDAAKRPPGTLNEHDILTGSTIDGTLYEAVPPAVGGTCADWTSSEITVVARLGHHDKDGPPDRLQWNSAHDTSGCAEGREDGGVGRGGGSGRFYCFAAD
jgi:hypothetical protein